MTEPDLRALRLSCLVCGGQVFTDRCPVHPKHTVLMRCFCAEPSVLVCPECDPAGYILDRWGDG